MATSGAHTKRERNKHTHPHTHTWLLLAVVRQLSHKSPTPAKRPEPKRDCSGMPTSGASPCCTISARALLHLQHDSETHRRDPDPTSGLRHTQHKEIHTHAGRGREGRRVKLRRCTCAKKPNRIAIPGSSWARGHSCHTSSRHLGEAQAAAWSHGLERPVRTAS